VNSGVGSGGDDVMDECAAAMVLMSLSCSPHSPHWDNGKKKKNIYFFGTFPLPKPPTASTLYNYLAY